MTSTVNRYRVFCTTEATNVFGWNTSKITACPNNNTHTIDSNSIVIVDSVSTNSTFVNNLPTTTYQDIRTVERTPIIDLKSLYGKSTYRENYYLGGSATITNVAGTNNEYNMAVTANGTDYAFLQSAERIKIVGDTLGDLSITVRLGAALIGNQVVKIGIFDGTTAANSVNGYYFKLTATGNFVTILSNSSETNIAQTNWNNDTFNGSGKSQITLTPTNGTEYNIRFNWDYNDVEFRIVGTNSSLTQNSWLAHSYRPTTAQPVLTPNLPISVIINNAATASTGNVYVSNRQYSVLGKYQPIVRVNSAWVFNNNIYTCNLVPVISIQRLSTFIGVPIRPYEVDLINKGAVDILVLIYGNISSSALTGASFTTPPNLPNATDSAIQYDTSASFLNTSGGSLIWSGMCANNSHKTVCLKSGKNSYDLIGTNILSVCVKNIQPVSGGGQINALIRWTEEW